MAATVNVVQPAVGHVTVVNPDHAAYTVRYTPPAGRPVTLGNFRIYCHACHTTLLSSPNNPATFDLAELEYLGHPGPFDVTIDVSGYNTVYFEAFPFPAAGGTATVNKASQTGEDGGTTDVYLTATPSAGYQFKAWSLTVYDADGEFVRERIRFSTNPRVHYNSIPIQDGYRWAFEAEFETAQTNMWATIKAGEGTIEPMAQTASPAEINKYWLLTPAEGYWCAGMIKSILNSPITLGYRCAWPNNYNIRVYKGTTAVQNWPANRIGEYPGYFFKNRITFKIVGNGAVNLISNTDSIYNSDGTWCKDATGYDNECATAFSAAAAPGWVFSHFIAPGGQRYAQQRIQVTYGRTDVGFTPGTMYHRLVDLTIDTEYVVSTQTYDYGIDVQKMLDNMGEWTAVFVPNPNGSILYGAQGAIIFGEAGVPLYGGV